MAQTYTIVKKGSTAHQSAVDSRFIQNKQIIPVGTTHVLVPANPSVDFGHNVSHAKNRTQRLRRPNLNATRVEIGGETKTIRMSSRDLRTYKKIVAPQAE